LIVLFGGLALGAGSAEVERLERGNLVIEAIPEIPESVSQRLSQYGNTRSASLEGWHPSGEGILISTRFGETTQLHWVKEPGGSRSQITFFDEPVRGATVSPNADVNGFIFSKDIGGTEMFQLYFYDAASGTHRMLTDGESRNMNPVWANDGERFVYTSPKRNGRNWDIYAGDIGKEDEAKALLQEGGVWGVDEWSPDDSKLIVGRYVSINESYPYIFDLETGKLTPVNPSDEKVAYGDFAFAKDGKGIYFTSDQGAEFKRLQYYNLKSGKIKVLSGDIDWSVETLTLSDDGRYLAFTVNANGISRLYVRDLRSGKNVDLPETPVGQIYGLTFEPDGKRLGMVLNTPQTPGDIFSLEIGKKELVRWTHSEIGGLDTDKLVVPELIGYPTFDEVDGKPRVIPAFYYKPAGEGPFPVVIDIHGGPEAQRRPFFRPMTQYVVNELGMAYISPNVRGSDGYGKSYLQLDNGFKREDSVKDIGALLDWIATRDELDADRVVVSGGSYGGYMVLAAMVHYSDRLRAGIDVVGISNFVTFLTNTKPYRQDMRRAEYGDERDPEMNEFLVEISPLTHADKITKPIFIVQGYNDPRVPVTESEQMVSTIRESGGEVWYLLAMDEGHGFRKKSNRDYFDAAVSLFLERYALAD
jgi:dipeptidyl aminopeptidase/acylaminoacyl peptidase